MIKFFRAIRQRLLSENKFTKYLVYAIGEIILVVIGILIALQINNNNEAKKDRAFELKMLKEISKSLDTDINYIEDHMIGYRIKEVEKSITYFKRLLKNEKVDKDSLRYYFNWTTFGLSFQVNEGPYQGLKSIGLDKISNDSLRNSIQYLYDFIIPRTEELIEWGEETYDKRQQPLKELFYLDTEFKIRNDDVIFYTPIQKGEFWKNTKFLELLRWADRRSSWNRSEFERLLKKMKFVKNLIDKQIDLLSN